MTDDDLEREFEHALVGQRELRAALTALWEALDAPTPLDLAERLGQIDSVQPARDEITVTPRSPVWARVSVVMDAARRIDHVVLEPRDALAIERFFAILGPGAKDYDVDARHPHYSFSPPELRGGSITVKMCKRSPTQPVSVERIRVTRGRS